MYKSSERSDTSRVESCSLIVLELEVEVAAGLEGVKVERPGPLSAAAALLGLRVQGILACVELLPHFWKDIGMKLGRVLRRRSRK